MQKEWSKKASCKVQKTAPEHDIQSAGTLVLGFQTKEPWEINIVHKAPSL